MDNTLEGMTPEQVASLALLARNLSSNPETRNEFLGLTKRANPNLSIPEVDLPNELKGMIASERSKREELEKKILEAEVRQRVIDRRNEVKAKKSLSDSDIAEVEKLMTERGITNHETAADFYLSQQKSAVPTPYRPGFSQHSVPKMDLNKFGGNLTNWARQEAASAIDGFRSGRIAV